MARGPKPQPKVEEVQTKDYTGAVRTYRQDILPAIGKVGNAAQEASTAYKHIKKNCHIQPAAARLAFSIDKMEEAARDDFLRSLNGLLTELRIFMPRDMIDIANGAPVDGDQGIVPTGERPKSFLAAVSSGFDDRGSGPEGDNDLVAAGDHEHAEAAE
jgi:hypothetical protein